MWLDGWVREVECRLGEDDGVALVDEGLDGVGVVSGEDVG